MHRNIFPAFLSGGRRSAVKTLNGYSYLTLEQRREIERMYAEGERVADIADDDSSACDHCISEYVPPVVSVVNLGNGTEEATAICKEMVRQRRRMIKGFTLPQSQLIRELCSKAENRRKIVV